MENVELVRDRETDLEFDINIQGTNKKEPAVRFVIEGKDGHFTFPCNRGDNDEAWVTTVPAIPQLKNKAYPFRLEVIVDGYYFEPYRGTVDILVEPEVHDNKVKQPEKPVVNAVKTESKKKITKEDLNIEGIIDSLPDLIKSKKNEPVEEEIVEEIIQEEEPIEETVEEIVEDDIEDLETVAIEEEVEEDEPEEDSFGNMATAWLNRPDDEETVVETKTDFKEKIKLDGSSKKDFVLPSMLKEDEPEENLSEKEIKIRAILSSSK